MKSPADLCSNPILAASAAFAQSAQTPPAIAGLGDSIRATNPAPADSEPGAPLTPYCPVIADTILYIVGERGFSFSAAAEEVGITFQTLCRWRLEHRDFDFSLINARRGYRTARICIIQWIGVRRQFLTGGQWIGVSG